VPAQGLCVVPPQRRQLALAELLPGVGQVDGAGFALELAHGSQVRHDKARGRPGMDRAADEPVHEAVVEFEVGREVLAAHRGLANHLRHVPVAVETRIADGQEQGDVGVVGAGEACTS
jgi:hypothetical protein